MLEKLAFIGCKAEGIVSPHIFGNVYDTVYIRRFLRFEYRLELNLISR